MSGTTEKVLRKIEAKTANYTVDADDWGKVLTNRGAVGAVTITLPAVATLAAGFYVDVFVVADQSVTLAGTAGELVTFNDAAANSIALSTASEKIGGGFTAINDGTSWLVVPHITETQTVTIAT